MNSIRSFQTIIIILVVAGLLLLALGGYLAPLSRVALSPFVDLQTWFATRFQAVQDFNNIVLEKMKMLSLEKKKLEETLSSED